MIERIMYVVSISSRSRLSKNMRGKYPGSRKCKQMPGEDAVKLRLKGRVDG